MNPSVTLKPGKDIPLRAGHPWVFSNAIDKVEGQPGAGDLVIVRANNGEALGIGTWNGLNSIRVRILERDVNRLIDPDKRSAIGVDKTYFSDRFADLDAWKRSHLPDQTDGYRLVHAEADGIPGLIVDRYADTIVFQIHTVGMDRFRAEIVEALIETFKPKAIVERSDVDARTREGLMPLPAKIHHGTVTDAIPFKECGITFLADVINGQKTGFFLDQRDARRAVGILAKGKRVLNLFGYTGAFSIHAALGGATFVTTVDVSRPALELAERNFRENGLDPEDESKFLFLDADVMDVFAQNTLEGGPYDFIVCDPPAFAKTDAQVEKALKAYAELNASCLRALAPGGILVTSSCSGRVTDEDFRNVLKLAAGRAKRDVRLIEWLGHPADHAERLAYPEGRYLKTAVLEVT